MLSGSLLPSWMVTVAPTSTTSRARSPGSRGHWRAASPLLDAPLNECLLILGRFVLGIQIDPHVAAAIFHRFSQAVGDLLALYRAEVFQLFL
jgi:hypothetical protein